MRAGEGGDRHPKDGDDLEQVASDRTKRPYRYIALARERPHFHFARGVDHEDDGRGRFAEERDTLVDAADRRKRHPHPDPVANGDLREGDAQAARVTIVRRTTAGKKFYEFYLEARITGLQRHWMAFSGQELYSLFQVPKNA